MDRAPREEIARPELLGEVRDAVEVRREPPRREGDREAHRPAGGKPPDLDRSAGGSGIGGPQVELEALPLLVQREAASGSEGDDRSPAAGGDRPRLDRELERQLVGRHERPVELFGEGGSEGEPPAGECHPAAAVEPGPPFGSEEIGCGERFTLPPAAADRVGVGPEEAERLLAHRPPLGRERRACRPGAAGGRWSRPPGARPVATRARGRGKRSTARIVGEPTTLHGFERLRIGGNREDL